MWPSGTEDSKPIQIGEVDNQLTDRTSKISTMLDNGLQVSYGRYPLVPRLCIHMFFLHQQSPTYANLGLRHGHRPTDLPAHEHNEC